MQLRDYQVRLAKEGYGKLKLFGIVYLAMEVRCGKTLTALQICELFGAKKVLFLTKKKAIKSVQWDYDQMDFSFRLTVANDESMHLVGSNDFDVVIHDEQHRFGAYPKPNSTAKAFKGRFGHLPMIFLSGTPTPESHSQWYHQFWVSERSPFREYTNFYAWAKDYVNVKLKHLGYAKVNDYSDADRERIMGKIRHYLIRFTQAEAGFTTQVREMVLFCDMKPVTHEIVKRMTKDLVVSNKAGDVIMADTGAKLSQKVHQLFSGTCRFEDGSHKVIDTSKAEFIKQNFQYEKIAIFYKFVAELEALKSVMGDMLTTDIEEFRATGKWIALQIVSGREGISLKEAKYLVYYNIDFSAVSYWQSRDRLTTMERTENEIFWVFAKGGIEEKIYKRVMAKKDFTTSVFLKEYNVDKEKFKITSMHIGSSRYQAQ